MKLDTKAMNAPIALPVALRSQNHKAITAHQHHCLLTHSEVIVRPRPTQIDIPTTKPGVLYRHHMTVAIDSVLQDGASHNTYLPDLLMQCPNMIPMWNIRQAHITDTLKPVMSPPGWITMIINENSLMKPAGLHLDTLLTMTNGQLHRHTIVLRVTLRGTRLDRTMTISHTTTGTLHLTVVAPPDPDENHMITAVVIDPLTHIQG